MAAPACHAGGVTTTQSVDRAPGRPADDPAARAFSVSMLISGIRCTLTYVVFPWILPALGVVGGVGPLIGAVIGVVAIACNIASIRRFWRADHRWKLPVTVVNLGVMALLAILLFQDIAELL